LIFALNANLIKDISNPEISDTMEILTAINEYNLLKVVITRSIGRMRLGFD
jgi:hypothetical protein